MKNTGHTFKEAIGDNASLLLTIYGAVSVIGTGILSSIASIRAKKLHDKMIKEVESVDSEEERTKIRHKYWIKIGLGFLPTALVGGTGVASIIGSYKISTSAAVGAAVIGERAYKEIKDRKKKLVDKDGNEIKPSDNDPVFDSITGQKVSKNGTQVQMIIDKMKDEFKIKKPEEMYLHEFYDRINIEAEAGNFIYWSYGESIRQCTDLDIWLTPDSYIDDNDIEHVCWKIEYGSIALNPELSAVL